MCGWSMRVIACRSASKRDRIVREPSRSGRRVWLVEEAAEIGLGSEHSLDACPQAGIAGTGFVEIGGALDGGPFQSREKNRLGRGHFGHGCLQVGSSSYLAHSGGKTHHVFLQFSPEWPVNSA